MPRLVPLFAATSWLAAVLLVLLGSPAAIDALDFDVPVAQPTDDCYSVFQFSTEWFINNKCYIPLTNQCVFYTSMQGGHARSYSKDQGFKTIWDLWPAQYYDPENVVGNPMRCIFYNFAAVRVQYFAYMSQAFASICSGSVQVMDADINTIVHPDNPNLPQNPSLYFNTEFPQLRDGGQARSIRAIQAPSGTPSFIWWPTTSGASKRDLDYHQWHYSDFFNYSIPFNQSALSNQTDFNSSDPGQDLTPTKTSGTLGRVLPRDGSCGAYADAAIDFDACAVPW